MSYLAFDAYHDVALASSAIAAVAFGTPCYLVKKMVQPIVLNDAIVKNDTLSIFWYYLSIGFGASLLNGIGHHLLHNSVSDPDYMLMVNVYNIKSL